MKTNNSKAHEKTRLSVYTPNTMNQCFTRGFFGRDSCRKKRKNKIIQIRLKLSHSKSLDKEMKMTGLKQKVINEVFYD